MRKIGTVQIGHRQLTEDVIKDRRRLLDAVVALHHARWLEFGECERIDELFQWYAVLQTDRDRDGEVVHHRPEARAFFVHIDEDFAQLAVFILTRAEVHLVPTHDGLLSVALAALRHLLPLTRAHLFDDDLLDDLFGQNRSLLVWRTAFEDFSGLIIIFDQRSGQGLRQLRAIAVQCVGFDPEGPAQLIRLLAVLDCCIIGHVDCFGDRARDERLRRGHHGDVAVHAQEALALLAAWVGTIKDVVVTLFKVRRTLKGHGAADMVVSGIDCSPVVPQMAQQIERRIVQLGRWNAQRLGAEVLAQRPLVEHKADVKGTWQGGFDLVEFGLAKAVADQ